MDSATDELTRAALELLDGALNRPPLELKAEVDDAERAVVALRDNLIDRCRQTENRPDSALRQALDQVNVALSLVVGIEYPVGGLQRALIQQARQVLAALV
ncbi:MAG TPA: hypothetical protein VGQ62_21190 [Chloroflexota bacterium]|nr:hypothetical protein [Chloroflexota bacterium]